MNVERRFNLIKTDFEQQEKRTLPRFPFCYLTFKSEEGGKVFEIKDISYTGMQLAFKESSPELGEGENIQGEVHWLGRQMKISGKVQWKTGGRVGVEFIKRQEMAEKIKIFLDTKELASKLKPLHQNRFGLEIPAKLKYWLCSDGPVSLFMWQHSDGELAHVEILLLENFIEWKDGVGVRTGRILSKRNVDTPLLNEDEMVFRLDQVIDEEKVARVTALIKMLNGDLIPLEAQEFLLRKLTLF